MISCRMVLVPNPCQIWALIMVHKSDYQNTSLYLLNKKDITINKLQRACSTISKGFNKIRMTPGHRAKEPMPKLLDMARWCVMLYDILILMLTDQKEDFRASTRSTEQPIAKRERKSFQGRGDPNSTQELYIIAASKHNHYCISVTISIANGSMPCFQ